MEEIRERVKKIRVEPYGVTLHLFVCEDIRRSFERRNLPLLDADSGPDESTGALVWRRSNCSEVFAFLPEDCSLGKTAHEMYHVVAHTLQFVGIKTNDEEVWAYPLGALTQKAAEFVHAKDPNKYRGGKRCSKQEVASSIKMLDNLSNMV